MDSTSRKVVDLLASVISMPEKTAYTRDEIIAMLRNIIGLSNAETKNEGPC